MLTNYVVTFILVLHWQSQWEETTEGAITKEFFPHVERRLAVNLLLNPNVT
jgi:hypothetical protein